MKTLSDCILGGYARGEGCGSLVLKMGPSEAEAQAASAAKQSVFHRCLADVHKKELNKVNKGSIYIYISI